MGRQTQLILFSIFSAFAIFGLGLLASSVHQSCFTTVDHAHSDDGKFHVK